MFWLFDLPEEQLKTTSFLFVSVLHPSFCSATTEPLKTDAYCSTEPITTHENGLMVKSQVGWHVKVNQTLPVSAVVSVEKSSPSLFLCSFEAWMKKKPDLAMDARALRRRLAVLCKLHSHCSSSLPLASSDPWGLGWLAQIDFSALNETDRCAKLQYSRPKKSFCETQFWESLLNMLVSVFSVWS